MILVTYIKNEKAVSYIGVQKIQHMFTIRVTKQKHLTLLIWWMTVNTWDTN